MSGGSTLNPVWIDIPDEENSTDGEGSTLTTEREVDGNTSTHTVDWIYLTSGYKTPHCHYYFHIKWEGYDEATLEPVFHINDLRYTLENWSGIDKEKIEEICKYAEGKRCMLRCCK